MYDSILLVVDSVEGPIPQTRFILNKALKCGMKVLVVVKKDDHPSTRPDYVVDKCFDMFMELGATDGQIDSTTVFASGPNGIAVLYSDDLADDMEPLFNPIKDSIDPPTVVDTSGDML